MTGDPKDIEYLRTLRFKELDLWPLSIILENVLATLDQIQADIAALQDASAAAATELQQLADQVSQLQAGQVTQAQIDNLHDSLQSVTSSLVSATQSAQTQTEPPVVTPFDQETPEAPA